MWIISILILIVGIILCILGYTEVYKKQKYNEEIEKQNNKLSERCESLKFTKEDLSNCCNNLEKALNGKAEKLAKVTEQLNDAERNIKKSFENYCDTLESSYKEKEQEYECYQIKLKTNFDLKQDEYLKEVEKIKNELKNIQDLYTAAILAKKREEELDYTYLDYSCVPTQEELDDIEVLNRIKPKLNQPRILSMLIWSTYYQKPMTALCNKILGLSTVTGIYKITNHLTGECYIGQAVDVASRWKQHAKCGLGIDTPAANKLYKSMLQDGLHNFTFELIEKCQKEQLNEKEKFYINLYNSCDFGFNSNKGVG